MKYYLCSLYTKEKQIGPYQQSNFQPVLFELLTKTLEQWKENTKSDPVHHMSIHQRSEKKIEAPCFTNILILWDAFKAQATDFVKTKLDPRGAEHWACRGIQKNMMHMQPLDLTTNGTTKKDGKPSVKSIFCRLYHKRFVTRPWKRRNYHRFWLRRLKLYQL